LEGCPLDAELMLADLLATGWRLAMHFPAQGDAGGAEAWPQPSTPFWIRQALPYLTWEGDLAAISLLVDREFWRYILRSEAAEFSNVSCLRRLLIVFYPSLTVHRVRDPGQRHPRGIEDIGMLRVRVPLPVALHIQMLVTQRPPARHVISAVPGYLGSRAMCEVDASWAVGGVSLEWSPEIKARVPSSHREWLARHSTALRLPSRHSLSPPTLMRPLLFGLSFKFSVKVPRLLFRDLPLYLRRCQIADQLAHILSERHTHSAHGWCLRRLRGYLLNPRSHPAPILVTRVEPASGRTLQHVFDEVLSQQAGLVGTRTLRSLPNRAGDFVFFSQTGESRDARAARGFKRPVPSG